MSDRIFEDILRARENGEPIARFAKAIIGRVNVKIIDQITGNPTDLILYGDAKKGDETAILTFWVPYELAYFERANKRHITDGTLVPHTTKEEVIVSPNSVSDETIRAALESRFFTIQKMLKSFTSPVPVRRMLALAEDMNKTVGTVNAIKARLSELQADEYKEL